MAIRPRGEEDVGACIALLEAVHERDGYPVHLQAEPAAFLLPRFELNAWVSVREGSIVGHVALHHDPDSPALAATCSATGLDPDEVAVVSRLFVAPSIRRNGVARALLDHAGDEARAMGRRPILDVVQHFHAAVELYDRAGWDRVGEMTWHFPDRRPVDAWLYVAPDR